MESLHIECIGRRCQLDVEFSFNRYHEVDGATLYSESNTREVSTKYLPKLKAMFEDEIYQHIAEQEDKLENPLWEDMADDARRGITW
jgi:hypothetical protein